MLSRSRASGIGADDAVLAALKSRLQALERENIQLAAGRAEAAEVLLKAKEQKANWFKKARDLRLRLVKATGQAEPELEEDEPLELPSRAGQSQAPPLPNLPPSAASSSAPSPSSSSSSSTTSLSGPSAPSVNGHPSASSSSSSSSTPAAAAAPGLVYTPPQMLQFAEDSPFFRKELEEHRVRVEALARRLKQLIDRSNAFCTTTQRFAQSAQDLSAELVRPWDDVEGGIDNTDAEADPVSLSSAMGKLGAMLSTVSDIAGHLRVSVDAFLIQSMDHFRNRHIQQCSDSVTHLERARDEYEAAITRRLARRKKDMGPSGKLPCSSHDMTVKLKGTNRELQQEDEARRELAAVATARRAFELLRFDHSNVLNEMLTERRLELIEMVCASFLAFITFFHEGGYVADSLKQQVDNINLHMQWKRPLYVTDKAVLRSQRKAMETAMASLSQALEFHVQDAIPTAASPPSILPPSADAAAVVMRRGKPVRLEKSGYLRKQSSSLKKDWKRRWFSLQQGQLFYVRSWSDLEPVHVVNVLICTVRLSTKAELDLCFDLISPNKRVYTLQADSEQERKDWMAVFQDCVESMLTSSSSSLSSSEKGMTSKELARLTDSKDVSMEQLRRLNPTCADCSSREPDWASINLGVMICIDCSGIHRNLGVHVSKVRSITLDSWTAELLDLMLAIGNARYNELYEGSVPAGFKPEPSASRDEREEYITLKYGKRAFLSKLTLQKVSDQQQLQLQFMAAVRAEAVLDMMGLLALQVDIDAGVVDDELQRQAAERIKARDQHESADDLPSPASPVAADDDVAEGRQRQRSRSDVDLASPYDENDVGGLPRFHFASPGGRAMSPPPAHSPVPAAAASSSSSSSPSGADRVRVTRALHVAARWDKVVALEYLLQNNAKDSLLDELGRSPLQVAIDYKSGRAQHRLSRKVV